ncbi:MAG: hypothetical protein ACFCBW_07275 [Candidatus Competibacterales bacterium]
MSSAVAREKLDTMILLRLYSAKQDRTPGAIARDLAPLLGHRLTPGQIKTQVEERLKALQTEGKWVNAEKKNHFVLSEAGVDRALGALGGFRPARAPTWKAVKEKYLVALACELELRGPEQLAKLNFDGQRALILNRHYHLGLGPQPTLTQVVNALTAQAVKARGTSAQAITTAAVQNWWLKDAEEGPGAEATPEAGHLDGADLPAFMETVKAAAQATTTGRMGDHRVFINHVYGTLLERHPTLSLSLEDFKDKLAQAKSQGLIVLVRNDLPRNAPPQDMADSETAYLNTTFHLIDLEA